MLTTDKNNKKRKQVRFVQLVVAPWDGEEGITYSVYGLTKDGKVFQQTSTGWKPIEMLTR